jgi:hypothetical protein
MATATKQARATTAAPRAVHPMSGPAPLTFLTYRDNGDYYHWEIVDGSGESLAHSGRFASERDAERAARRVCEGVRSADFEPHVVKGLRAVAP